MTEPQYNQNPPPRLHVCLVGYYPSDNGAYLTTEEGQYIGQIAYDDIKFKYSSPVASVLILKHQKRVILVALGRFIARGWRDGC